MKKFIGTAKVKKWNLKFIDEKNKYLSIFQSIPNPVIILDDQNVISNINDTATELFKVMDFNVKVDNLNEKKKFSWIEDELKYFCSGNYSEISFIKEYKSYNDNLSFKVKLKKIRVNDNFIGTIVILDDITNSKKVSEELEHSEKSLREITESMKDLICKIDINGKIQYIGPSVKQILGYNLKDLIGKYIFSNIHPEDLDKTMSSFNRGFIDKSSTGQELRVRKQDGHYIWVKFTYNPLYDENGNVSGAIIVAKDITKIKELEEELKKFKLEVESAKLAKSEFLANVSNEIKNPLNSIIDMTDVMLFNTSLNEEQNEYMSIIKKSSESLLKTVDNMLGFSKIESGKVRLEEFEFNIKDIIYETLDALAIRAHEKNLELMIYIHPDLDENLIGDYFKLKQIIINIVGNAIKFTEKGEVAVYVEKVTDKLDKISLKISVIDTGIGMTEENINKLNKYFNGVGNCKLKKYAGNGLGLILSKQLIELMDGEIWFESKYKKGTSFYLTLDFKLQQYKQEIINYNYLKDLNVLLVDDNKTNRTIVYNMLNDLEMGVRFVANAEEGLSVVREYAKLNKYFDVIIIDEIMPGMNGFTLASKLKKEMNVTNPIIMMLSSMELNKSKSKCKQMGLFNYLVKPIKQSELCDVIKNALNIEDRNESVNNHCDYKFFDNVKNNINKNYKNKINVLISSKRNMNNNEFISNLVEKRNCNVFYGSNKKEIFSILENNKINMFITNVENNETDVVELIKEIRNKENEENIKVHLPIIVINKDSGKDIKKRFLEIGANECICNLEDITGVYSKAERMIKSNKINYGEQAILDLDQVIDITGGEEKLFKELIEVFFQAYPEQVRDIKEAIEKSDSSELQVKSNNLKQALRSLGAKSVFDLVDELENMAKNNDLDNAKKTFERIQLEIIRLKSVLNKIQKIGKN
ncbi:histidine kinase [Clostridium carboxidivorans P7]|uniref:Circadian input-output histidine kinase CikA n=1 Tax=Clostridium carboxidivorans P7 TaxID=536227 RepID=C6PYX0_9CLOT|nr:PAS domain S-box protein [Clostridium carboxidivorans]AKN33154.1 histidine kinase [Clostridium carboxidivorans P7]EET85553.1 multi-sensor hybrid histidine kinase [Clostridium carboxidivorans P7]EFG86949.1 PAS domain S-box domain-containing protein [Clostridium carboxidivorans P7]